MNFRHYGFPAIATGIRRAALWDASTMNRRSFLKTATGFAAYSILGPSLVQRSLRQSDDAFLDDMAERSFRFFWEQSDPHTGLARDRTASGRPQEEQPQCRQHRGDRFWPGCLCIGAARKAGLTADQARTRVRNTLTFFAHHAPHEHGWFYHCMDIRTGQRSGYHATDKRKSELSSIDSAYLVAGVLTARQYFHGDPEIVRLADLIYQRVDFRWMLNGHPFLLSQGWMSEEGFIPYRWDSYCELTLLYLLGIGSPTHRLDPASWYAWNRDENVYDGCSFVGKAPLFTHQFSHAFIDYRNRREARGSQINWFDNSVTATHVNRQLCMDIARQFPGYSESIWGVTSSDSAKGYVAWGGPPYQCSIDGTVVPCAAGGALMFTPEICVPALRSMYDRFGQKAYGRYGFVDAFHPTNGWVNGDYVGIDVGITLLAAENLRSGNLWTWFTM